VAPSFELSGTLLGLVVFVEESVVSSVLLAVELLDPPSSVVVSFD
jgi:hypothetical protein